VVYTWLHHTDSDVPHLSNTEFSFMRGAFLSIDRPYGRVLNFLHHNIGSSHVVHHVCPKIPHYHAKKATVLTKKPLKKHIFLILIQYTELYGILLATALLLSQTSREDIYGNLHTKCFTKNTISINS